MLDYIYNKDQLLTNIRLITFDRVLFYNDETASEEYIL